LLPTLPVTSGSVEYIKETAYTPAAGVIPETQKKPEMAATYAPATTKCATIADCIKATLQSIADVPSLNLCLDQRLSYSVSLKEESLLLNGDVPQAIQGLMDFATAFVYTPLTTDTGMDILARAAGALMKNGYVPDGVVLAADDFTAMRLLKSTTGSYIFMGTAATGPDDEPLWEGTPLTWQIPTVISPELVIRNCLCAPIPALDGIYDRHNYAELRGHGDVAIRRAELRGIEQVERFGTKPTSG
jgi:HK97 family phage major capsid protein